MFKTSLLLLMLLFCTKANAQMAYDLEIFSEDGLKFTLFANGAQVNETPQANVKLINTNNQYIKAKIVFEDQSIPNIEKNTLQIAGPVDGFAHATVYKIVLKKGAYKLKWVSRSQKPVQPQTVIIVPR